MRKDFFTFTEIKTKVTTSFPFVFGLSYLFYLGQPIKWGQTLLFFASMMFIDLATTAINNYIDSKTNGQVLPFARRTALILIGILLAVGSSLGLLLAYLTDVVVLLLGALCVLCGVVYTYGPVPISRQPYGEVISGLFQGGIGPFLLLYINMPEGTYLALTMSWKEFTLSLELLPLFTLFLLTLTPMCLVANVMLANNICDVEKDIENKRFTLAFYLGRKALPLFAGLYFVTYLADVLLVAFGFLPPLFLLALASFWPVWRNIGVFYRLQDKGRTFAVSIKNFFWIMGASTGALLLCSLL